MIVVVVESELLTPQNIILISTPAFCKKLTQQQQQRTCLELEMDFSE
jgi:hypothetical protein